MTAYRVQLNDAGTVLAMTTAVVLGAGFSYAAGLPLTGALFDGDFPCTRPGRDHDRMAFVRAAYRSWSAHSDGGPEAWLRELYDGRDEPRPTSDSLDWHYVVQYLLRRVCLPRNADAGPYYYGITRASASPVHRSFWDLVLSSGNVAVITMNYDILVERALNYPNPQGKSEPIFYYGGFQYEQHVRKMVNVSAPEGKKSILVPLGHDVPLYKLHGSANWAWEPHTENLKIHDDVRAAYREKKSGTPAIIPPIEEKEMSSEFTAIWTAARKELEKAQRWIVCGYSLPFYDRAARDLFRRSALEGPEKEILLIDPDAHALRPRWLGRNIASVTISKSLLEYVS